MPDPIWPISPGKQAPCAAPAGPVQLAGRRAFVLGWFVRAVARPGRAVRAPGRGRGKCMALMTGKQGLIMGVANDRSLAWGIAKALHAEDAKLAFTFQG